MYFKITGNDHIFYQNITFSKNNLKYFILRHEEKQICLFVESGFFKLKQPPSPKK